MRPERPNAILGIGRHGTSVVSPVTLVQHPSTREMFEVFASAAYGIFDGDSRLATVTGHVATAELYDRHLKGEDIYLEEYDGAIVASDLESSDMRPAPHATYFPTVLLDRSMRQIEMSMLSDVRVSRPLFAQTTWLLHRLKQTYGAGIAIAVDNKTYPVEMSFEQTNSTRCKVSAITRFVESRPISLLAELTPFRAICDGLVVE